MITWTSIFCDNSWKSAWKSFRRLACLDWAKRIRFLSTLEACSFAFRLVTRRAFSFSFSCALSNSSSIDSIRPLTAAASIWDGPMLFIRSLIFQSRTHLNFSSSAVSLQQDLFPCLYILLKHLNVKLASVHNFIEFSLLTRAHSAPYMINQPPFGT